MLRHAMDHRKTALALAACAVVLAGCGGSGGQVRDALGLTTRAPDEFQVVQRAPLVLPPDYNLRPPQPGAPRPQEPSPRDGARADLLGGGVGLSPIAGGEVSPGQQALLGRARTDQADPEIRRRLGEEVGLARLDERMFAFILSWQRGADADGVAIDPFAESERLRAQGAGSAVPPAERLDSRPIDAEDS